MTTTATTTTTGLPERLQTAVRAAQDAAGAVDRWQGEMDTARALIDRLEADMGVRAVEAPESAGRIADDIAGARSRLAVARAALPEAQARHRLAVAAALKVEADALEPERRAAVRALEAHEARTAELLAALKDHTRAEWRRIGADEFFERNPDGRFVQGADAPLRRAVAAVERRQTLLRGVAAGKRVHEVLTDATWEDLGACLRPGGVADLGWIPPEDRTALDAAQAERDVEDARAELAAATSDLAGAQGAMNATTQTVAGVERWTAARDRLNRARGRWFTVAARHGVPVGDVPDVPEHPEPEQRATRLPDGGNAA